MAGSIRHSTRVDGWSRAAGSSPAARASPPLEDLGTHSPPSGLQADRRRGRRGGRGRLAAVAHLAHPRRSRDDPARAPGDAGNHRRPPRPDGPRPAFPDPSCSVPRPRGPRRSRRGCLHRAAGEPDHRRGLAEYGAAGGFGDPAGHGDRHTAGGAQRPQAGWGRRSGDRLPQRRLRLGAELRHLHFPPAGLRPLARLVSRAGGGHGCPRPALACGLAGGGAGAGMDRLYRKAPALLAAGGAERALYPHHARLWPARTGGRAEIRPQAGLHSDSGHPGHGGWRASGRGGLRRGDLQSAGIGQPHL